MLLLLLLFVLLLLFLVVECLHCSNIVLQEE